jgi:predicted solute-binding protein
VRRLSEIAHAEAPRVGLPEQECLSYLRDNLVFNLGSDQKRGLAEFYRLAGCYGLAPTGVEFVFSD